MIDLYNQYMPHKGQKGGKIFREDISYGRTNVLETNVVKSSGRKMLYELTNVKWLPSDLK